MIYKVNIKVNKNIFSPLFLYRLLIYIVLFLSIFYIGLQKGGRWDLNDQILTGLSLFNKFSTAYSAGIEGSFQPITVYSFFQPLCLGLFSLFIEPKNIELISVLFISPFLGVLFFHLLFKLSLLLSKKNDIKTYYTNLTFISIIILLSKDYLYYLSELKPDTLALIFLILVINNLFEKTNYELTTLNTNLKIIEIIKIFLFTFIACSTKQQIIIPFFTLSIILIYLRSFFLFIVINTSCLLSLLLPTFFINDYFLYTILAHTGRGVDGVLYLTYLIFNYSLITSGLGICSMILLNSKYYKHINNLRISFPVFSINLKGLNFYNFINFSLLKNKYSLNFILITIFISWLFIQTMSTYRVGGNMGNYNIGFIPLIIILYSTLLEIKNIHSIGVYDDIKQKNFINLFLIFYLLISLFQSFKIYQKISFEQTFYHRDNQIIEAIKDIPSNYSTPFIVDGNTALLAKRAGFANLISLDHASHLANGNGKAKKLSGDKFLTFLKEKEINKFPYLLFNSNELRKEYNSKNKKRHFFKNLKSINEKCIYQNNFCSGYILLK